MRHISSSPPRWRSRSACTPSGFDFVESFAFGFAEPPGVAHRAKPDGLLVVGSLRNSTTGEVIAPHVSRARAPWTRALGYLHRRNVDAAEGLWFDRCSSIHTVGLRASIDVVFVDREHAVVRVVSRAQRNRIFDGGAQAAAVIELGAGVAATHVRIGDRLRLE